MKAAAARPKRNASTKKKAETIDSSSDSEAEKPATKITARAKKQTLSSSNQNHPEEHLEPATKKKTQAKKAPVNTEEVEEEAEDPDNAISAVKFIQRSFNNLDSHLDIARECDNICKCFRDFPQEAEETFFLCMARLLIELKPTPQIVLCLELMQSVISRQSEDFQIMVVTQLLDRMKCKDRAVRLRSLNLVRYWLRAQTQVLEQLHSLLISSLLESTLDKNGTVRTEAVLGLEYFQNPSDSEDAVNLRLCQLAREDPLPAVRKACFKVLIPTAKSIDTLVLGARDDSAEVRNTVFKELRDRFSMDWFSAQDLTLLFDQGLSDPVAKEACEKTLKTWFDKAGSPNAADFLRKFDVGFGNESTMLIVLHVLQHNDDKMVVTGSWIGGSKEDALCTRFVGGEGDYSLIDTVLRLLSQDSDNDDDVVFVTKQLLLGADMRDSPCKERILGELVLALTTKSFRTTELVGPMMRVARQCVASDKAFVVEVVTGVLSSLSELSPLEEVEQDIQQVQHMIEACTAKRDYSSLERLCGEMKILQDRHTILLADNQQQPTAVAAFSKSNRAAHVALHLLQMLPRAMSNNNHNALLDSVLDMVCLPGLQSTDTDTRFASLTLLGLLGLGNLDVARTHALVLANAFMGNSKESLAVRVEALKVIFDLLLCYGKECVSSEEEFDALVQHLMEHLDMNCERDIRSVCALGLAKLLFLNRVAYPGLVQCLLIVLFHPSSQDDTRLVQYLSTFFAEYQNTRVVLEASEPLVQAMLFPTADSLCEDLPVQSVLERLHFLLRNGDDTIQFDFIWMLLDKLARYPAHAAASLLVQTLVNVDLRKGNNIAVPRLRYFVHLVELVLMNHVDKTTAKRLARFVLALKKLDDQEDIVVKDAEKADVESKFHPTELAKARAAGKANTVQPDSSEEEEEEEE